MSGWGAMKKELIKIRIFQFFGHFDSIEKTKNLKKAHFFDKFAYLCAHILKKFENPNFKHLNSNKKLGNLNKNPRNSSKKNRNFGLDIRVFSLDFENLV
jgi:hypothetical protein